MHDGEEKTKQQQEQQEEVGKKEETKNEDELIIRKFIETAVQLQKMVATNADNTTREEARRTNSKGASGSEEEATTEKNNASASDMGKWPKLAMSLVIDGIGMMSFAIPGLGEMSDVFGAPALAVALQKLYGSATMTTVLLVEELLPFTDAIPTATIAWLLEFTMLGDLLPFLPKIGKRKKQSKQD